MEPKKEFILPMKLQMFAEEGNAAEETPAEAVEPEKQAEKAFTRSEIAKMIAAEKSKWEKEYQEKIEKERNEAARLAKLSEEERQKALIQKERDELEQEKTQFRKQQLIVEKGKQLQELGIPSHLANRIQGETAEEAMEDVKAFKAEWEKALQKAVDEALRNSVDKPLSTSNNTQPKLDLTKITYEELLNLKNTNPEAYKQAIGN